MASILQRPILVGGVGLSLLLWFWQSFDAAVGQLDELVLLGAIAIGGLLLFQKKKPKAAPIQLDLALVERATVEKAIASAENGIIRLESEAPNHNANPQLRQKLAELTAELDRQQISLAVTGGKGVGKTSLVELLQSTWLPQTQPNIQIKETPALLAADEVGLAAEQNALAIATASDLVLFLTSGDLTDSELQILEQLKTTNQPTVLVFNKQDQYLPEERELVLNQLQQRMPGILGDGDVVAIAANPKAIKVLQHQSDGSVQESWQQSTPAIELLTERLNQIIAQHSQQLVLATTWRQAIVLAAEAKSGLNQIRRDRALPAIEQYQWITAATAFANPVPALDLVATGAINAQLIVDLSGIYQQKFSLEQAKTLATTMGSLMLKLGLVEFSTQTITSVLKTNAITFVAGGLVQGVSAAYFTRIAGLSLIEYFQEQETVSAEGDNILNMDSLREKVQTVFQQNQRIAFVQSFVKQAVTRLMPESPQPQLASAETIVNG